MIYREVKMKSINDITFDSLMEDYQSEILNINKKFEQLDSDKSFQKLYHKYLKSKNNIRVYYNKITDNINNYKMIDTKNYAFGIKKNSRNGSYQFDGRFC